MSKAYTIKVRERHDAGFWNPWFVFSVAETEEQARRMVRTMPQTTLVQAGVFQGNKRLDKPLTKDQQIAELEERLASAECIIRQVARDTYGEDMTPAEFAERSCYDS